MTDQIVHYNNVSFTGERIMLKNNSFLFKVPAYIKLVFVMLFCLTALCSCGGGDNGVAQKGQPINNPSAKPIVTYPADAEVDFNDTVVVVADVSFHYYNGNVIIVWEQEKFYS